MNVWSWRRSGYIDTVKCGLVPAFDNKSQAIGAPERLLIREKHGSNAEKVFRYDIQQRI